MVKKLLELIENINYIKIYYKTFMFKQTLSKINCNYCFKIEIF